MRRSLLLLMIAACASSARAAVVVNEVDADQAGTDSAEFIELFDEGAGNTSLDGYYLVLINGANESAYREFDLTGFSTDARGFFVIGSVAGADIFVNETNWLQNGADGVGLYTAVPGATFGIGTTISSCPTVVGSSGDLFALADALVYDTNDADDFQLLFGLCQTTQYDEAMNGASTTQSLQWSGMIPPTPGEWAAGSPTPDLDNFNSRYPSSVPSIGPTALFTLVPALLIGTGLAAIRRRR